MRALSFVTAAVPLVRAVYGVDVNSPPATAINPLLYNDLIYYAELAAAGQFIENGSTPCKIIPHGATLLYNISIKSTDTQAIVFKNTERREIVATFPGTASYPDIATDLAANLVPYVDGDASTACGITCQVHAGFQYAWTSIEPTFRADLTTALQSNPGYTTKILGISLGGALASLAFNALQYSNTYRLNGTFTYGEPRTGNGAYADFTDKQSASSQNVLGKYYRTTHANDPVPKLPPDFAGYVHSRTELWESTQDVTLAQTFRCYGRDPSNCNNADSSGTLAQQINAHGTYGGFAQGAASCGYKLC